MAPVLWLLCLALGIAQITAFLAHVHPGPAGGSSIHRGGSRVSATQRQYRDRCDLCRFSAKSGPMDWWWKTCSCLGDRPVQILTLAARHAIPVIYGGRADSEATA